MFDLPSISGWAGLHPGISHFPIALLLAAPVLVLVGLLSQKQRHSLIPVAVWLMLAGTVGIYLSAASGDAAKLLAPQTPEILKAIEVHETLGSVARVVFTVLTVLLAGLEYGPRLFKKQLGPRTVMLLTAAFLVVYIAAGLILLNAAHSGGLLVHKLGVHAKMV